MDLLRTTKTYKTREGALKKLKDECEFLSIPFDWVNYLIAVHSDGRYAPVVCRVKNQSGPCIDFVHRGITIVG